MAFILSPNMDLPVPVVGQEPGPDYAKDVNNSLTLIDAHDHSPGKGVPITPAGLNINTNLTMQGNFLTNVAGVILVGQSLTPPINTIYQSGADLFFVDANGNNIQLTANGGIAGTSGSISNLVPPASAAYIAGLDTFVWQSNTNIAANMDFGSAILRNLSPNSTFGLTLSPPAGLSLNYTLTLPLPPSHLQGTSFLTIDEFGNIYSSPALANGITAANIAPNTITAANIAPNTITAAQIANNTIGLTQLDPTVLEWNTDIITTSGTFTVPPNVNRLFTIGVGGGGGAGGVATSVGQTGGAGGGSTPQFYTISVSPGDILTISIGAGGIGSNPGGAVAGGNGGDTTLTYPDPTMIYATPSRYTFTVTSANATAGATYTNNGQTFTVLSTISAGTSLQTSSTGAPTGSGTLLKTSGTGDATITFSSDAPIATGELLYKGAFGGAGNASGLGGDTYTGPVYSGGFVAQSGGSSGAGGGQSATPTAFVGIGAVGGADLGGNWGGGGGGSGLGPGSPGTAAVASGPTNDAANATNPGSGGGATGAASVYSSGGKGGNGASGAVIITWLGHA